MNLHSSRPIGRTAGDRGETAMVKLLMWIGRIGGLVGVLMLVVSVGARSLGMWRFGDLSVGTVLLGSVAMMVLAALAYAAAVAERGARD
jgi:hypothetical protein